MVRFRVDVFLAFWQCGLVDRDQDPRTAQSTPAVNHVGVVPTRPFRWPDMRAGPV
jgi:hypothetical protein